MTAEGARAFVAAVEKDLFDLSVDRQPGELGQRHLHHRRHRCAGRLFRHDRRPRRACKYALEAAASAPTFRASIRHGAQARYPARRLVLAGADHAGRGDRAQQHRDPAPVALRQGQGHAERQADHRRRHRSADGQATAIPAELAEMWSSWHDNVGAPMRDDYARLVEIANAGRQGTRAMPTPARCGARNYDMPPEEFAAMTSGCGSEVKPLYDELHCYTRDQAQREIWRQRPARDRPDPRRSARQHVGAGMGQHLRRGRAQGRRRRRL